MVVGTAAEGPVVLPVALLDRKVVDTGDAQAHQPLCCTDQQPGEVSPPHLRSSEANVLRPPQLQLRFNDAIAMATSVICRPSVRDRSASSITRFRAAA
jgi:hypothetical protein